MKPEEMRRHGTALAERVRRHVDTEERLSVVIGQRRRRRRYEFALAAAAVVIVVLVGVFALLRPIEGAPVITDPDPSPTTLAGLRSLPVELFLVLVSDYTVDAATGECSGSGVLEGVEAGSRVSVVDDSENAPGAFDDIESRTELASLVLPAGAEITQDAAPAFLLPVGPDPGCVFSLGDHVFEVSEFDLVLPGNPNVSKSETTSGQRHVTVFEG
jgi:hypothetical protein